jgi:hypothetical protein
MRKVKHVLFVICVVALCNAQAQQKPCTQAEQDQVEKEATSLRTWDALYKSYRHFKHCWNYANDVDADEGYSESIARILADHWETLPRLAQLINRDKGFGKFVGLDGTMDMDDVKRIRDKAQRHCPAGLSGLCAKLKRDADEAVAENDAAREHN